ncbi:hypothetical protein ACFUJ0_00035 [Streptomyces sp. NPDC057242]|uniref:hypothetical protein n=1 Tax=unclassified Streptomyces TaxID=2593676 RepID=UPI00363410BD
MKTRETASAGYRLALEAHLAAVDPALQRPAAPGDGDSSRISADAQAAFADYRAHPRSDRYPPPYPTPLAGQNALQASFLMV